MAEMRQSRYSTIVAPILAHLEPVIPLLDTYMTYLGLSIFFGVWFGVWFGLSLFLWGTHRARIADFGILRGTLAVHVLGKLVLVGVGGGGAMDGGTRDINNCLCLEAFDWSANQVLVSLSTASVSFLIHMTSTSIVGITPSYYTKDVSVLRRTWSTHNKLVKIVRDPRIQQPKFSYCTTENSHPYLTKKK